MARISGSSDFPYAIDLVEAPYTDGLISSAPEDREFYIGAPATETPGISVNGPHVVEPYLGATTLIHGSAAWHPVFAGDF